MGLDEPIDTLNHRLESVPVEAMQTHAATALAQGLLVGKGRGAVAAWRRSVQDTNPALAHALYLGELHVLAAINPRAAAASILGQPRGEDRDQAIGVLLSRTINRDQTAREVAQPWVGEVSNPALRKTWERTFKEVNNHPPRKFPERLSGGFDAQTYSEFQRRLDLLSTYPMKTP